MLRRFAGHIGLALLLAALPLADMSAQEEGTPEDPVVINPLTGLPATGPEYLLRNPVIAKVSNAPAGVRPQAGLEEADLVFEHYAEGGLTRFSAIFYGQRPQRVGSIRSARLIDLELLPMLQGLLAWSGASIGVEALLNASAHPGRLYKGVLYNWPLYWRDPDIPSPHNLFVSVAALGDLAVREGVNSAPDLQGLVFQAEPPAGDSGPALSIDLRYLAAQVRWEYDADSGHYLRYADGEPHHDATTGRQLRAANVIVLYAGHRFTDIVESVWQGVTHYSIEIDLSSGGEALLLRDGRHYAMRWQRPEQSALLQFSDLNGAPLALKPGNSWLQVMRPPANQVGVESVTVNAEDE